MNVATTRAARHQIICVGNAEGTLSLAAGSAVNALVEDAQARKCVSGFEAKNLTPPNNLDALLSNKEKQLQLHTRITSSKTIAEADKKRSVLTIVSLQQEIVVIKKQRLEAAHTTC
jgi:hypothetical protein